MKILSFGCGRQTVAIVAMCANGDFEKPDYAIFADPQAEDVETYEYLKWIEPKFAEIGIKYISTTRGNIVEDALSEGRFATMPVFTKDKEGKVGMLRRQCTNEYKIQPVLKTIRRDLLGLKKYQRYHGEVEMWLGYDMGEAPYRITDNLSKKTKKPKWLKMRYPLVEKMMFTDNAIAYLKKHKWPIPPKSACFICPFRSDASWKNLKVNQPDRFELACQIDDKLRRHRVSIKGMVFLHRSCIPLREVPFTAQKEMPFGCDHGFCGV